MREEGGELAGYLPYGAAPGDRFRLMRRRGGARWWDQALGVWVGEEQPNVAPALAWALSGLQAPRELRAQVVGVLHGA